MKKNINIMHIIFILFQISLITFLAGYSIAQTDESYVSEDLVRKAATYYAKYNIQNPQILSITPYYAFDGSINAYAVQFAKDISSAPISEEKIKQEMSKAQDNVSKMESEKPSAKENKMDIDTKIVNTELAIPPLNNLQSGQDNFFETKESSSSAGDSWVSVIPEIFEESVKASYERNKEIANVKMQNSEWEKNYHKAMLDAVLVDKIWTIVISARYDQYPMLEAYDGVAPHLRYTDTIKKLSEQTIGKNIVINKTYFLAPCFYIMEVNNNSIKNDENSSILINPINEEIIDKNKIEKLKNKGRLKSTSGIRNEIRSETVWESIDRTGFPPKEMIKESAIFAHTNLSDISGNVNLDNTFILSEPTKTPTPTPTPMPKHYIPGVPYYLQKRYDKNSCGPTSSATVCGYWDMHGYGNLIDNGDGMAHDGFQEGNVWEAVYHLMECVNYNRYIGTWPWDIDDGVKKFSNEAPYANFSYIYSDATYYYSWSDIVNTIDKKRPPIFNWWVENYDVSTGHFATIVGCDDDHVIYVHPNWSGYSTNYPLKVNLDNVASEETWLLEFYPPLTSLPYDCIWSEDFEAYWGSWIWYSDGAAQAKWWSSNYHAHNMTYDPYPPCGSKTSNHSAYCYPLDKIKKTGSHYVSNMSGALIYGPFSTLERTSGEMFAFVSNNATDQDDKLGLLASVDGKNFSGDWYGRINDWTYKKLDLNNVPGLGNLMGKNKVWVALWFKSDEDTQVGEGAYVDDLTIRLYPYIEGKLPAPKNAKASWTNPDPFIKLTWDPVQGASCYRIQSGYENGSWRYETEWIAPDTCVYEKRNTILEKPCVFKVQAARSPSGHNASDYSNDTWATQLSAAPTGVKATDGTYTDKVTVTWNPNTDDTMYYKVYRSTASNGNYISISPHLYFTSCQWDDYDAIQGQDYYYKVRAMRSTTTPENRIGPWSTADAGWRKLKTPKNVNATDGTPAHNVVISCDLDKGFYYRFYRSSHPEAIPDPITDWKLDYNYWGDATALPGETYYYRMKKAIDNKGTRESAWSAYNSGWRNTPAPTNVSASDGTYTDKIRITWNTVSGAKYYSVYCSNKLTGTKYPLSIWQTATSYDYILTDVGTKYYFWIKAALTSGGYRESDFSNSDEGYLGIAAPSNLTATNGTYEGKIRLNWNSVPKANGYRIYRSETQSGTKSTISSFCQTNQYDDNSIIGGKIYYYWVKTVIDTSGITSNDYSNFAKGMGKPQSPQGFKASDGIYDSKVLISWTSAPNVSYYKIVRAEVQGGLNTDLTLGYQKITSFNDYTATAGKLYYYNIMGSIDSLGQINTGLGTPDTGWKQFSNISSLKASDGTDINGVLIEWQPVTGASYFQIWRKDTIDGEEEPITAWLQIQEVSQYLDTTAVAGKTYWYSMFVAADSGGQRASNRSNTDSGWRGIQKWNEVPNTTDGIGQTSYKTTQGVSNAIVADDFECQNGLPIKKVIWYGSYSGYEMLQSGQVASPSSKPISFILSWYTYEQVSQQFPPRPGTLLGQTTTNYKEEWYASQKMWNNAQNYEHIFYYECDLSPTWNQTQGQKYFITIQAVQDTTISPFYGWKWWAADSSSQWNSASMQDYSGGYSELFYPVGHRLQNQKMDMSFTLLCGSLTKRMAADDNYEENDVIGSAWWPGSAWPNEWLSSKNGMGIQSDFDWYKIYVRPGHERIIIDCIFTHASGNIDIALYTLNGRNLDSTSTTDNEHIDYKASAGTTDYYILVYGDNSGNSYDLIWNDVDPNITPTPTFSPSPSPTPIATASFTPSPTPPPTITPTITPAFTPIVTPTLTPYPTITTTPTPNITDTPTPTSTNTPSPTPTQFSKHAQSPNYTDGFDTYSWKGPQTNPQIVYDDWMCMDGKNIKAIRWWGSYPEYESDAPGFVLPPDVKPTGFQITMYTNNSNSPGSILFQETADNFYEEWDGIIADWDENDKWEHEFKYEYTFKTQWTQQMDSYYWLSIRAIYDQDQPEYSWGWLNTEMSQYNAAIMKNDEDILSFLKYPSGHRLQNQNMGMAFELLLEPPIIQTPTPSPTPSASPTPTLSPTPSPTPTESPTPSPTPTPTPIDIQWYSHPNEKDGFIVSSWQQQTKNVDKSHIINNKLLPESALVADDIHSGENGSISKIIWWGGYKGWNENSLTQTASPDDKPVNFTIQLYKYADGEPPTPGDLLLEQSISSYNEQWLQAIPQWNVPGKYHHIYKYEAQLNPEWEPEPGLLYFLGIQAKFNTASPTYEWGWVNSEDHWNTDASQKIGTGSWEELTYPNEHRLFGQSMDMAFAIQIKQSPTPSPTPSPSPTPTVSPTPTPEGRFSTQPPNLVDGYDVNSWMEFKGTEGPVVADDWEAISDSPISTIIWWGSYQDWKNTESGRVSPPSEVPKIFVISWHELSTDTFPQPGDLIKEDYCRVYEEVWEKALPKLNDPGKFEHEFAYRGFLESPWYPTIGEKYFINIQAVFTTDTAHLNWGWLNSEDGWGGNAVQKQAGSDWQQLSWANGHRLQGKPMDMAFEIWGAPGPTPSPAPANLTLTTIAEHGIIQREPDKALYDFGTTVTLNAIADNGYFFKDWTIEPELYWPPGNPFILTMDTNKIVTANFGALAGSHLLNITSEFGFVIRNPLYTNYEHNTVVKLTAKPFEGYTFSKWTGDIPNGHDKDNPIDIAMDSDKNITAEYTLAPTPTPTPIPEVRKMLDYLLGIPDGIPQDFNGDGKYDISDIIKYLNGKTK